MPIALRFSTTSDPVSALIRWRTVSPVSHVEFETKDGWTLGSRWPHGVQMRPPSANTKQRNVIHATFPNIELAYAWARRKRIGFGYDLLTDLGIGLNHTEWHDRRQRMCSETVLEAAEHGAGIFLLNREIKTWAAWPGLLLASPLIAILDAPVMLRRDLRTFSRSTP
jgi:hypothetical protein